MPKRLMASPHVLIIGMPYANRVVQQADETSPIVFTYRANCTAGATTGKRRRRRFSAGSGQRRGSDLRFATAPRLRARPGPTEHRDALARPTGVPHRLRSDKPPRLLRLLPRREPPLACHSPKHRSAAGGSGWAPNGRLPRLRRAVYRPPRSWRVAAASAVPQPSRMRFWRRTPPLSMATPTALRHSPAEDLCKAKRLTTYRPPGGLAGRSNCRSPRLRPPV